MRCPVCKNKDTKVVDSRPADDLNSIRRRRCCEECGYRFTTYERKEEKPLLVIKRDGAVEAYDSDKLLRGILISCAKRPINIEEIENLTNAIEKELREEGIYEITSSNLGDRVIKKLAELDLVAYVRFASVYKDFNTKEEFHEVLDELK